MARDQRHKNIDVTRSTGVPRNTCHTIHHRAPSGGRTLPPKLPKKTAKNNINDPRRETTADVTGGALNSTHRSQENVSQLPCYF